MNFIFDNVDFNSTAGPYWFANKLRKSFENKGHIVNELDMMPDAQLSFVSASERISGVPLFQRLDGIWYDTETDYKKMNEPIKNTYDVADGVIFQSKFDHDFISHHFGVHSNYAIIHNGSDLDYIQDIPVAIGLENIPTVWTCASSWVNASGSLRHNKRLNENIRYFQEHSSSSDILCVAGDVGTLESPDPTRIVFLGELAVFSLISLYKRSDWFIHLAAQDHCPNVVVDAKAAGCRIVCASSGGTAEIAGKDAVVVIDSNEHGFVAYNYNVPTTLDFSKKIDNWHDDLDLSIDTVADQYLEFIKNEK